LLLFLFLVSAMQSLSFTGDEPVHVAAGYTYLARRAVWMTPTIGHPPLAQAWESLLFYLGAPDLPIEQLEGWGRNVGPYVQAFASYLSADLRYAEFTTRIFTPFLALLLAAVVFRWATDLWGIRGGYLALLLVLVDPLVLGHGALATNDIALTAIGTTTLFIIWRLARRPTLRLTLAAGILLGMTLSIKGSGVTYLPAAIAMVAYGAFREGGNLPSRVRWAVRAGLITAVALLVLWAVFGFEWGPIQGWSMPLPAPSYWSGVVLQADSPSTRWNFLLGEVYQDGRWFYFPVAFLLKNPVSFVMLVAISIVPALRRFRPQKLLLWSFPLLYTLATMQVNTNIGYRHFLPVHPFLYLLVAQLALLLVRRGWRLALAPLLVWQSVATLSAAPNTISYFTPVLGGPAQAWRYLADSNTDWGQAVKALRAFQQERQVVFNFRGRHDPIGLTDYGVEYDPLALVYPPLTPDAQAWLYPRPGHYVLSANTLSGFVDYADNYSWFRYHPPDAVIAGALFYYHVPSITEENWLAQCTDPVLPLDVEDVARGFGDLAPRPIALSCTQSWIYPAGEDALGWYVLSDGLFRDPTLRERLRLAPPRPDDAFIARHLAGNRLVFRQWGRGYAPPFAMFQPDAAPLAFDRSLTVYPAAAEALPPALDAVTPVVAPQPLDGPLTLVDARIFSVGGSVEVETWWRVTSGPVTRPLSVMAHLLTPDGTVLGVADGMGVPPIVWQAGDVIVQRHVFPAASSGERVWLRTGAYWSDDGARWAVSDRPSADALFIALLVP
jgi:4-amino-4-deoxy-L-arabinose transferase-like glycosyltransferase